MISMSCIFTNLYKVFFLNDFIDLKVFFGKWHKVGTGIAIYKGRVCRCARHTRLDNPIPLSFRGVMSHTLATARFY